MKKLLVFFLFALSLIPITLNASETKTFNVNVDNSGEYYLNVEYKNDLDISGKDNVSVKINGSDMGVFNLPKKYSYSLDDFETDRYGKEIISTQVVDSGTNNAFLNNIDYTTVPMTFALTEGNNVIEVENLKSNVEVSNITALDKYSSYESKAVTSSGQIIEVEAENFDYKNAIDINAKSRANSSVTPKAPGSEFINVIDGDTFNSNGYSLSYIIDIPEAGMYDFYLSGFSEGVKNLSNYINIYVNGNLASENVALLIKNAYETYEVEESIYLDEGSNVITFELALDNYADILNSFETLRDDITSLSTQIVQITGGIEDESRDWAVTNFIPDLEDTLNDYLSQIDAIREDIISQGGEKVDLINTLDLMEDNINELIYDIDNVPNHMSLLSSGSTSVLTLVNQTITRLSEQGLEFDKFVLVSSGDEYNSPKSNLFEKAAFTAKSFMSSFQLTTDYDGDYDQEIEVWVNKPRQYVDVMQKLTDQFFTPDSGIKVNFSVLTDQNKLTMANAAKETPDAAISIDSWYAYELGLRGALVDLNTLEGTDEMISNVTPGGLLQVIIDDSLYGISETQDLYVMYYRTDIFEDFGYSVPDNWDDVLKLLPDLMGNGKNFYIPLSATASLKTFPATSMFFMQNEVPIYEPDGFSTTLDTNEGLESLKNMTNMYELYGLELNTANFFDSFKSGDIPIGISNFSTYIQLSNAADEIEGNWSIAPVPGMVNEDGETIRWHSGSTTVDAIFNNSSKVDETAEFLNWWTTTETQTAFNDMLISIYGVEYLWNSANVEAFLNLPLPEEHLDVFEESLSWVQEVPKVPGGYIVERSISDIWNGVVFDGEDIKRLTEDKVQDINAELKKKLIEFGYIDSDGNKIKDYKVPTIDGVNAWLEVKDE